jgi:hypothetical protein
VTHSFITTAIFSSFVAPVPGMRVRAVLSKISGRTIEELEHASFATKLNNMGRG